ncbi:hypothetical protein F4559_005853 [Saccharothrix violaceirubra]|uniref:Uncharacterized protein n=1 Tax=Saccharothrix violaceirubra TaxID=413306 RepID=A0A7W7WYF9_9PSEU|nr:hypothetical protein [Saccharothrix violaceirubra]
MEYRSSDHFSIIDRHSASDLGQNIAIWFAVYS